MEEKMSFLMDILTLIHNMLAINGFGNFKAMLYITYSAPAFSH